MGRSRPNQPAGQSLIEYHSDSPFALSWTKSSCRPEVISIREFGAPSIDSFGPLSLLFPLSGHRALTTPIPKPPAMESMQSQNTSVQRLQNVEKRIVRVLELAGGVMDELANPAGPRKDLLNNHCGEFMKLIKDIQVTLREEIKSACEYRPFEKSDYGARLANEICCKKLEYTLAQLDSMKQTIDEYHSTQG